jgi:hypothetical protein
MWIGFLIGVGVTLFIVVLGYLAAGLMRDHNDLAMVPPGPCHDHDAHEPIEIDLDRDSTDIVARKLALMRLRLIDTKGD